MTEGFRHWLGPTIRVAVDPDTGREYRWDDVVVFEEGIAADHRRRILAAVKETAFLREACFLFFGQTLRLSDIHPPACGCGPGASALGRVYRLTVQTRLQGAFDLTAAVNLGLTRAEVVDELHWLVLCGEPGREPLVADVGGYWEGPDLWSEELLPGETLERALRRQERARRDGPPQAPVALRVHAGAHRLRGRLEPHGTTLGGGRPRTGERHRPHPRLPDGSAGGRLARVPHPVWPPCSSRLHAAFLQPVEEAWPVLRGMADRDTLFSAVLEAVGEEEGLRLLRESGLPEVEPYAAKIDRRGFLPSRLFFAAKRYRRWAELTVDPTRSARARTLLELWETYGLQRLLASHPEARVRFFRETVLQQVSPPWPRP